MAEPTRDLRSLLRLQLVTDRVQCGARGIEAVVAAAVRGGASCVQLREKALPTRDFVEQARALKRLLAPLRVPLIVNDRLDVALACDADGVHVGQSDMPVESVRRILPGALIGLSIESLNQLLAAADAPVDYFGASPIFSTASKADAAPALGLDGLRMLRAQTRTPIVAIGGIDVRNAAQVIAAGADGIAVISALCTAADPQAAARELRSAMEEA